ncbi:hypothetical protein Cni_G28770 [Canna indica]|uniref:Uncharacterized protein n=1 Tax=Canna indica TaxID=4628 RepID=A0AAQ3L3B1_9LILI|nr:hypothetical protein Cni_G28770 [Canna indica]
MIGGGEDCKTSDGSLVAAGCPSYLPTCCFPRSQARGKQLQGGRRAGGVESSGELTAWGRSRGLGGRSRAGGEGSREAIAGGASSRGVELSRARGREVVVARGSGSRDVNKALTCRLVSKSCRLLSLQLVLKSANAGCN